MFSFQVNIIPPVSDCNLVNLLLECLVAIDGDSSERNRTSCSLMKRFIRSERLPQKGEEHFRPLSYIKIRLKVTQTLSAMSMEGIWQSSFESKQTIRWVTILKNSWRGLSCRACRAFLRSLLGGLQEPGTACPLVLRKSALPCYITPCC